MNKILIGLVFLVVNLTVNSIDLIPDWLGFILIMLGAREMMRESENFARLKPFAMAAALFALVIFVAGLVGGTISILPMLCWPLSVYVYLLIVRGVRDLETKYSADMHSADMMKYMNFGVVGSIVLTVLVAANVGVLALIVGIVTVVFMGLYIYNFYLAKQVYESIQNG